MFRPRSLKLPLIALALCLVSPASGNAAGNQQDAQSPPNAATIPNQFAAVVCKDEEAMGGSATAENLHKEAAAGTEPKFQTIRIGPGQNPADVCRDVHLQPVGLIYKVHVNGVFMAPSASFTTAPAGWDDLEMQLNKDAQMQLDNRAALELRNKTPGQKTSGQQPP